MSIQEQFTKWLRNMGFHDDIPDNLHNICNPSTSCIFSQLISEIQPKEEVDVARANIIINRLRNPDLNEKHCSYPVKEIEIFKKKIELENKIKVFQDEIEENQRDIDQIMVENNRKYITTDRLKQQIRENTEKTFLLKKKTEKLEAEISHVEELVVLTPIEEDDSSSPEKITETLQSCAAKLEKLNLFNYNNKVGNNSSMLSICNTPGFAKINYQTSYYSYVKDSAMKQSVNQEKFDWFPECTKGNASMTCYSSVKKPRPEKTKRESFGLLADDCFENLDQNDFLMPTILENHRPETARRLFIDESSNKSNLIDFDTSVSGSYLKECENSFLDKISENKEVGGILKGLLHTCNRGVIFKVWQKLGEDFHEQLKALFLEYSNIDSKNTEPIHVNKVILYGKHVKNELEILKMEKINEQLRQRILSRTNQLRKELTENQMFSVDNELLKSLDLEIEECSVDSRINFLQKEKNLFVQNSSNTDNLDEIDKKIDLVNKKIDLISNSINDVITLINRVFELMKNIREETVVYAARLNHVTLDPCWIQPLIDSNFQKEIELFRQFSLQFNRKIQSDCGRKSPSYNSSIPLYIELDSNILNHLAILLETPFTSIEHIMYNKYRQKLKITLYKKLITTEKQNYSEEFKSKRLLHDLVSKEDIGANIINQLKQIEYSSGERIIVLADSVRLNLDLWLETRFGDYLLPQRQFEDHNYNYYWKKFIKYNDKIQ